MLNLPTIYEPVIRVIPKNQEFGEVPVGDPASATVVIANYDGHHAEISEIRLGDSTDPAFSLPSLPALPVVVPSQGSTAVEVDFCPTCGGDASGCLEILSDDPLRPVARVLLHGVGLLRA